MVAELVEPIPIGESESNGTGKRRGRPPKLNADGSRLNPPKIGKPKKLPRRAASKPRSVRSLRAEIGAFLTLTNTIVIMSPLGTRPMAAMTDPNIVPSRIGDELDAAEIDALASAIDTQCIRSPRFRKYVERALAVGSGGQLVSVLGIIATRRAARHGLAPAMLDPMLGMMLAGGEIAAMGNMMPPEPPAQPDPVTAETEPNREAVDFENIDSIGTFSEP